MRRILNWKAITAGSTVGAIVYAIKTGQSHGRLLRVPFDFRFPTPRRIRQRLWNPDDPRIITPRVFGVGWTLNAYQLIKRVRGKKAGDSEEETPQQPD